MRTFLTFLACLAACGPLAGCAESQKPKPNIVVVLVDTLRFDRLGAYGNDRNLTPFLDSLAARGHVFRRVYAQSSWTNPSVASLLTSRYQSQHHVISFGSTLSQDELTLPEILQDEGYATAAFCANFLVVPKSGFGQGFDVFQTILRRKGKDFIKGRADAIHSAALAWLDKEKSGPNASKPFFLYLHYMEPHAPFDPPQELVDRVTKGQDPPDVAKVNGWMGPALVSFDEQMLQAAEVLYDAEVISFDAELRRMYAELEKRDLLKNTILLVMADHGEEFNEHGMVGHHQSLFEEVIRVPLIVVLPGSDRRTDDDEIVELTDIAPTLLDLLGVAQPPSFEGRVLPSIHDASHGSWFGLRRWGTSEPAESRTAFSELIKARGTLRRTSHERAAIVDGQKLIVGFDSERTYYDFESDPGEKSPAPPGNSMRARLDLALEQLYAYGSEGHAAPKAVTVDTDTEERMRALGYAH